MKVILIEAAYCENNIYSRIANIFVRTYEKLQKNYRGDIETATIERERNFTQEIFLISVVLPEK